LTVDHAYKTAIHYQISVNRLDEREDVSRTDNVCDDKNDKDNEQHPEDISAGREFFDLLIELRNFLVCHQLDTLFYSSLAYTHLQQLLSDILTSATGQSTLDFARDNLTLPLGFGIGPWTQDPNGVYFGGNNMEFTPRQMMAFGQMYMNGGRANGRQVVPGEWVELSLKPRVRSRRDTERQYGYGWWIRRTAGLQTPYAWGFGGQFIVLVPEIDLVVVTTSDSSPTRDARSQRRRIFNLVERQVVAPAAATLRPNRRTLSPSLNTG